MRAIARISDMRCGIYEQRPLVCRIYPAEINPFIELTPMRKACPPEAWTPGLPPLLRAGKLVGASILPLIQKSRDADANDVPIKQQVCALLGIDRAAVDLSTHEESACGPAVAWPYKT
jgi:hypothetical protein